MQVDVLQAGGAEPLAQIGRRALGHDPAVADERHLLAERPGLGEYLRSEAEASEVLQPLALAGPGSAGATDPLVCIVAGAPEGDDGGTPLDSEVFRDAVAGLRRAYELVVIHGPPLGDETGALEATAPLAGLVLACVGPALNAGRSGRRLRRILRRLPVGFEVVVVG